MVKDLAFPALADETRRAIVELLAERPRAAGEIAAAFPVSVPAISRHLRVLREGGIVEEHRLQADGRVRVYRLRPQPLRDMGAWLSRMDEFVRTQLDAFRQFVLDETAAEKEQP